MKEKLCQQDLAFLVEKNGLWSQVPVSDIALMGIAKRLPKLGKNVEGLLQRERLSCHILQAILE
jgi:hypothetical protein